jgi:catechol 2,3-dioxygenase-like lactoylglutathione lyase family enzyme
MLGSINIVAFVPTRDAEKARAFYEGELGLRFVKDDGFALVLDANGIMVRVAKGAIHPRAIHYFGLAGCGYREGGDGTAKERRAVREVRFLRAGCARNLDRAERGQSGVVQGSRRKCPVGVTALSVSQLGDGKAQLGNRLIGQAETWYWAGPKNPGVSTLPN